MALEFRLCKVCDERHAVRSNGLMSIHSTAAGERCEEPVVQAPSPRVLKPAPVRMTKPSTASKFDDYDEIQDAFTVAAETKHQDPVADVRPAKTVYVTKDTRLVSGGLPTLGRRSR